MGSRPTCGVCYQTKMSHCLKGLEKELLNNMFMENLLW